MSKVIAVIEKPNNCQECAFARCKYFLPFTTRKKGYYCELLPPDQRTIKNVDYNDDVHLKHCPLIPIPEKMEVCGTYGKEDVPASYKIGWNACIDKILKEEKVKNYG